MKSEHSFVDEARLTVRSGDGGNGMASFRREKFVAKGGPNGGDGGRGGDVVLVADRNRNTLSEFHYRQKMSAKNGAGGGSSGKTGADGADLVIALPVGTVVYDDEAPEDAPPLVDLAEDGQRVVVARGGKGGLGNLHFKSSRRQAPDFALPGLPGETLQLRLSLKLLADVGLVGFPNAGKSTLLGRVSAARPRVAAYPFTTLTPSLGVVERGDDRLVVADIPGLIEGAAEGAGLGHRFLRHVERTRVLVHLLDLGAMTMEGRDLVDDYETLRLELGRYDARLLERPEIVVLSKTDVAGADAVAAARAALAELGLEPLELSSATGEGVDALVGRIFEAVDRARRADEAAAESVVRGAMTS
jgi:GTP-binding protein